MVSLWGLFCGVVMNVGLYGGEGGSVAVVVKEGGLCSGALPLCTKHVEVSFFFLF